LLDKRLEAGRNLLEGRNNSSESPAKVQLEALHHLAELAENIANDWSHRWSSEATTGVDAIECGLKLRDKLVHIARGDRLGHSAPSKRALHLTQEAKDGLEGLDDLAGLLVGVCTL